MISRFLALTNKIHPLLWRFICLTISIVFFILVLINRSPSFLRPLGFSLRTDFWPIIPVTALFVYLVFRIPGRIGEVSTWAVIMVLFALPLAGLWAYGHTQTSTLSGLIPLNDARGFYMDALRLTYGTNFSFFASRRPLFAGLLSVLLALTNYNLMACLAALTAITAISIHLTAREIQRTHGAETAVFLLMMIFLYYRLHSGTVMSENLGVALGSLGFAILWRGSTKRKLSIIWFGILTTTLALNARAGAFFVLPLLIIWSGWLYRGGKTTSWKVIGLSSTAVILGFFLNYLLTQWIGDPSGIPFANFSYSLYSLAAGGKSWAYIAEVHPEVFLVSEPEHTRQVFQLAFDLMREEPMNTLQGAIFFWKALFSDTLYNVFSYVSRENWAIHPIVKWTLYLFSLIGICSWFYKRNSPTNSLVMACILGVFLSVPFAPPTDSFRIRPYAASITMLAALPALGFGTLVERIKSEKNNQSGVGDDLSSVTIQFSSILMLVTLIGPVILKYTAFPDFIPGPKCTGGPDSVLIRFDPGVSINLRKNTQDFLDWPPDYHIYLFRRNVHSVEDVNLIDWAQTISPSQTLLVALDLSTQNEVFVVIPTGTLPQVGQSAQLCGRFEENPSLTRYRIFYAYQVLPISQQ